MKSIFDWLPLSDRKGLPTPRVFFRDISSANGLFYCRTASRCIDDELDIDRSEANVIVLSTHWGDTPGSVIAHEHRHFQQHYGLSPVRMGQPQPCIHDGTLEGWTVAVRRFYLSQAWELDALIYSMKVHRDQTSEEHFEVVL